MFNFTYLGIYCYFNRYIYIQTIPIDSTFVCDIAEKFNGRVTTNLEENCMGELYISLFKFVMGESAIKTGFNIIYV